RPCSACCARGEFDVHGKLLSARRVSVGFRRKSPLRRRTTVARKTVLVCDSCGNEVDEGKGAVMRVTYTDARRGAKQADLCDTCSGKMPGRGTTRAGRTPKSPSAA